MHALLYNTILLFIDIALMQKSLNKRPHDRLSMALGKCVKRSLLGDNPDWRLDPILFDLRAGRSISSATLNTCKVV